MGIFSKRSRLFIKKLCFLKKKEENEQIHVKIIKIKMRSKIVLSPFYFYVSMYVSLKYVCIKMKINKNHAKHTHTRINGTKHIYVVTFVHICI